MVQGSSTFRWQLFVTASLLLLLVDVHAFSTVGSRVRSGSSSSSIRNSNAVNKQLKFVFSAAFRDKNVAPPRSRSSSTQLALAVNPIVVGSALGHIVGGNLSVPFVIRAVKTWYTRIPLPSWTPPNAIFAPVWTLLYGALGAAVARVALASRWKSLPVMLWACHYLLNLIWAPIFFGCQRLRLALVLNYVLVASMPFLILLFHTVDRTAALLLLPYTAWLAFATLLNQEVCRLNPTDGDGYNSAMMEAEIAKLQRLAAEKVGL